MQSWIFLKKRTLSEHCYILQNIYSLSHKTVNSRENFWNNYCFPTNLMRDETAKDNRQTTSGISYDLIPKNELAFSSMRNLQFYRF